MFEPHGSPELLTTRSLIDNSSLIIDPLNTKENQAYVVQSAILTGIGAALLSRVVAHLFVYRTNIYKEAANKYHDFINRQQDLIKQTPRDELFGRKATPAKTEFQANISQLHLLKKEVFRVSAYICETKRRVCPLRHSLLVSFETILLLMRLCLMSESIISD